MSKGKPASSGADPENLKSGGGALCRPRGLADEENFRFRWSKKAKIMLETKAFGETFLSVF